MSFDNLQNIAPRAALRCGVLVIILLGGCGSVPPAPPKQVQEYARHTAVGFEKYSAGQIGEARNAFSRALARAELDDDAGLIATAALNLGASQLLLDDPEAAMLAYGRASREARLAGNADLDWQALSGLAEALRRSGRFDKALEAFSVRSDAGKTIGEAVRLPAEVSRARALADSGKIEPALGLIETLLVSAHALPSPDPALAVVLHGKASILLAAGKIGEAKALAQSALEIDRALHHPPSVAEDHRLLGRIAAMQKDFAQATHHYQRAVSIFSNTGQEKRAAECRAALQKADKTS